MLRSVGPRQTAVTNISSLPYNSRSSCFRLICASAPFVGADDKVHDEYLDALVCCEMYSQEKTISNSFVFREFNCCQPSPQRGFRKPQSSNV